MIIETYRVAIKKSSSSYSNNHKTKGWDILDPITKRIFLTAGFDRKNFMKGPPKILKKSLEAQTGAQML